MVLTIIIITGYDHCNVLLHYLFLSISPDIDYLEEVQTELEPVESRYFEIGAMLHLKPDVLKGIQSRNQVSSSKAMNEMITEWLDKNYNIKKFGLPTWKSLVIAVAKRSGGANVSCAIDIANKHRESS